MLDQAQQHSQVVHRRNSQPACAAATREQADTAATLYKPANAEEAVEKGLQV